MNSLDLKWGAVVKHDRGNKRLQSGEGGRWQGSRKGQSRQLTMAVLVCCSSIVAGEADGCHQPFWFGG